MNGRIAQFHISLLDSITIVQTTVRDWVNELFHSGRNTNGINVSALINFDAAPFMCAILDEIFGNANVPVGTMAPSVAVLVGNGVDRSVAELVSSQVFQSVIDTISSFLPHLAFNDRDSCQYDFCGFYDVIITPTVNYD